MTFKLGKGAPVKDDRTLQLKRYTEALGPPPEAVNFLAPVPRWPMFGNDTHNDCVPAAAGHMEQIWSYNSGLDITPTEDEIVTLYENSGYIPGQPSTDNGWEILPMLKNLRSKGLGGRKIVAFAQLETGNWEQLELAIALFGAPCLGFALPDGVVPQGPDAPDWTTIPWIWEEGWSPNQNNGHCVPVGSYRKKDDGYVAHTVSWAAVMVMNRAFYQGCSDEAWVVFTKDWLDADAKSPSGLDTATLLADLAEVTASDKSATPPSHYWG